MIQLNPITSVKVEKIAWKAGQSTSGEWNKIGVLVKQGGADVWLGCFENKYNSKFLRGIQEGQTIEVVIEKNGDFYNFKQPAYVDHVADEVIKLHKEVFRDNYPRPGDTDASGATVPDPADNDW
jgi:hypothetical protein